MGKLYFISFLLFIALCKEVRAFYIIDSLVLGDISYQVKDNLLYSPELNSSQITENEIRSQNLIDSCIGMKRNKIKTLQEGKDSLLSIIGTFQFGTLSSLSKNIAMLSRKLNLTESEFVYLSDNLVTNYCSENLTVISKENLKKNLQYVFRNLKLPNDENVLGPHNKELQKIVDVANYNRNQLIGAIGAFRSICSWGGKPMEFGLMNAFLRSPHLYSSMVNSELDKKSNFKLVKCDNLICRQKKFSENDKIEFLSIAKQSYCHLILKLPPRPSPVSETLKKWNNETTDDDYVFQVSQVYAALTNTPNLLALANGTNNEKILSSSFDDYFQDWSKHKIKKFSQKIDFEEVMKMRLISNKSSKEKNTLNFQIDFGEIDKSFDNVGKISSFFHFSVGEKLYQLVRNQVSFDPDFTLKKEDHLVHVLKEHLIESSVDVYNNYFSFFDKTYFFNQVARGIYEDIVKDKEGKYIGPYKIKFYYGLFALEQLRNIRRVKN